MSRAVCTRCGEDRIEFDALCTHCGHRPVGEGRLVAWLLSEHNLTSDQLDAAAERVRRGAPLQPTARQLDRARRALGAHVEVDPGLSLRDRLVLFAVSVLLTPLPGLTLWFWWRRERPRAAQQALALSLPAGVLFVIGVILLRLG